MKGDESDGAICARSEESIYTYQEGVLNPGDATHMAGGMLKIRRFSSTNIGDKERGRRATLKLTSDETWSLRNDRHQLEKDSIPGPQVMRQ